MQCYDLIPAHSIRLSGICQEKERIDKTTTTMNYNDYHKYVQNVLFNTSGILKVNGVLQSPHKTCQRQLSSHHVKLFLVSFITF